MRTHILALALLAACAGSTADDDTDTDAGGADDTVDTDTDASSDDTDGSSDDTDTDTDAASDDTDDTDNGAVDADNDGVTVADGDCDDADETVFPAATERCDGVDQNCDPTDEAGLATFFPTAAGDPVDLTTSMSVGDPVSLTESGTLRLCGGSWSSSIGTSTAVAVTVEGVASLSRPDLRPGSMQFAGDLTFRAVGLTNTTVTGGTESATVLDDVVVTNSRVFLRDGTLDVSGSEIRSQSNTFAIVSGSPPSIPLVVTFDDTVVDDVVNLVGAGTDLTATFMTFTGSGGLGSPAVLFLEDSTFESFTGSVSGDGTGDVVVRRVEGTSVNGSFTVNNQNSLVIEDCDLAYESTSGLLRIERTDDVTVDTVDITTDGAQFSAAITLTNDASGPMEVLIDGLTYDGTGLTGASAILATGPLSLTLSDSTLSTGTESGLHATDTNDVTIDGCTFSDFASGPGTGGPFSANGGAVFARLGTATLTVVDATFTGNSATEEGGAIFLHSGSLDVSGSTFSDNSARDGAGIAARSDVASTTIDGCTFEDNAASRLGGGVTTSSNATTITGGAFRRNTGSGAAVWVNGTLTVTNVDLATGTDDNTPTDIGWSGSGVSFDGLTTTSCTTSGCASG